MDEKNELQGIRSNILFIDDEEDFLSVAASFFPETVNLFTAQTLAHAWSIIKKNQIDCIFCDINIGHSQNGMDFLRKCKSNEINIPFVIVSGYINKEKTIEAIREGAIDIIEKPIDDEYLKTQLPKYVASGKKINQITKDINSITSVTEEKKKENLRFVEDYLFHVQIHKNRKSA